LTVLHLEYRRARTESSVPRMTIFTQSPSRDRGNASLQVEIQPGKLRFLQSIASGTPRASEQEHT
jgi:hypothetical protein